MRAYTIAFRNEIVNSYGFLDEVVRAEEPQEALKLYLKNKGVTVKDIVPVKRGCGDVVVTFDNKHLNYYEVYIKKPKNVDVEDKDMNGNENVVIEGKEYEMKRYTWKELIEMFPSRWVILDEVTTKDSEIIDGVLKDACKDDVKDDVVVKYLKEGKRYRCFRTTQDVISVGLIGGLL